MRVSEYRVERHTHGMLVFGEVPASMFVRLTEQAAEDGWDLLDTGIAAARGATCCFSSKESGAAWREEIAAATAHLEPLAAWLAGTDRGISAQTIAHVLSDGRVPPMAGFGAGTPCDPSDFGRCHRLLELIPAWRDRLGEVAERYSAWRPLVEHWSQLTELYVEELPSGRAPKLYERLKVLQGR